jgi:hypothetical protein
VWKDVANKSDHSIHINPGRNRMNLEGEGGVVEGEHRGERPGDEEGSEALESRIRFTDDT